LVIISYTTGLSFAEERIGPLTAIITTVFYLLALHLLVLPNTPENPFASICSETLIKTTSQHLLLLVGFDTLIYRKYYDTPPILVGHQSPIVESKESTSEKVEADPKKLETCQPTIEEGSVEKVHEAPPSPMVKHLKTGNTKAYLAQFK
jgi:hypothetical protein